MQSVKTLGRLSVCGAAAAALTILCSHIALADLTPQTLPFTQNWGNTGLITADDNWSGVPGIIGYRGDGMTGGTAVNPQTVLVEGGLVVDVNANRTDPNTFATGGVSEFELVNPVVALQGSGTARAPHLVITLNTTGQNNLRIEYNLRDIDGSADNAIQPIALQYRIGTTGNYTNLPAGFVADASTGPNQATLVTPVSVLLPAVTWNQPVIQIRIITTDAVGSDEWVGIDDIHVFQDLGPDTDGDGVPDSIDNCPTVPNPDQADCDQDGIGDACDPDTHDLDCDGVPDSIDNCPTIPNPDQADCNGNTIGDVCEIALDPSLDCNNNGVLDSCELAGHDCNGNGFLDSCDILLGLSSDCNHNNIPDECETDCDGNGVPDACQIASNPSLDGNLDGVLDSCQIIAPVIINEILADPAASAAGDANGDGVPSTSQDEFIELYNQSANPLDVGGWTIATRTSGSEVVRHQYTIGTHIAGNCSAVIFGGGVPTGSFGGALVQVANHLSGLNLGNTGGTITIRNGKGTLITSLTYGSLANNDTSITRNPDGVNGAAFVRHDSLPGGLLFSPGRRNTGAIFGGCTIPPDQDGDGIPDASDNCPTVFNPNQADCDGDGIGDACETDPDLNGNGVPDNCESTLKLNEIRSDMPGSDCNEYVEIRGTPGASLNGLTLIVIGDGAATLGSGVIECVIPLQGTSIPTGGHFLLAESTFSLSGTVNLMVDGGAADCSQSGTLNLENSDNITVVLVSNFTGSNGQDLDTNNDGILDITPWSAVFDAVGILESAAIPPVGTEYAYGAALGFANVGPDGTAAPGHVYRCETSGTWTIGPFAIDATDTPGGLNVACPTLPCIGNIVINNPGPQKVDVDDLLAVITHWGPCPAPCPPLCIGDISPTTGNCVVNVDDLLSVITHWGPCP